VASIMLVSSLYSALLSTPNIEGIGSSALSGDFRRSNRQGKQEGLNTLTNYKTRNTCEQWTDN